MSLTNEDKEEITNRLIDYIEERVVDRIEEMESLICKKLSKLEAATITELRRNIL